MRRGKGVRIRGGTARRTTSASKPRSPPCPACAPPLKALCVAPFGMEEGTEADIPGQEFGLLVGDWVGSEALEARFDAIGKGFEGFFFGRFDVRLTRNADDGIEAFRAGRGFKILELNGVTSEATHIYHPGTPLTTAYRVLMQQWRIAFEIGEENHRRGAPLTSLRALIQLTREYRRTSRRHLP